MTVMEILYTGAMLFFIFYGAIFLTKFIANAEESETEENENNTKDDNNDDKA